MFQGVFEGGSALKMQSCIVRMYFENPFHKNDTWGHSATNFTCTAGVPVPKHVSDPLILEGPYGRYILYQGDGFILQTQNQS